MDYCKRCLYPSTKPDLVFDKEGVCSACLSFDKRKTIDWKQREIEFCNIATELIASRNSDQPYDCIIPVSGGKDSYYQTQKVLDYGLRPFLVNCRTCDLSDIGRRNLDGISLLGCDMVEMVPSPILRAKINRYALETIGDISWPEHVLIFTVPVKVAIEKNIPLIIWGENPQNEYGGPSEWQDQSDLIANRWLSEFGGLNGLRPSDIAEGLGGTTTTQEKRATDVQYPMGQLPTKHVYQRERTPGDTSDDTAIHLQDRSDERQSICVGYNDTETDCDLRSGYSQISKDRGHSSRYNFKVPELAFSAYKYPRAGTDKVRQIFLGHFFNWDGLQNAQEAVRAGFEIYPKRVEASGFTYENLDNYQTGLHDYFKYIKFGFGRATDICNNHIRRGRMSRDKAITHVNEWDGKHPYYYLGRALSDIVKPLNLEVEDIKKLANRFANKELFEIGEWPVPKFKVM